MSGLVNALQKTQHAQPAQVAQAVQKAQVAQHKQVVQAVQAVQNAQRKQPVQLAQTKQQAQIKQAVQQKQVAQVVQAVQNEQRKQLAQVVQTVQPGQSKQIAGAVQQAQVAQHKQVVQAVQAVQAAQRKQPAQAAQTRQVAQAVQSVQHKQVAQAVQAVQNAQRQQVAQAVQKVQKVQNAQIKQIGGFWPFSQQSQQPQQKQQVQQVQQQQQQQQQGGAAGSGYVWHRANAYANLNAAARGKRDAWLTEVKRVRAAGNMSWKAALKAASASRKASNGAYTTVKERTVSSYKGRSKANVKCSGPVCPGAYDKAASTQFRPQGHASKRVLTQAAAVKLLREYYRARGSKAGNQGLRTDITRARKRTFVPCPVKRVVDSRGRARMIATRTPECADNWLYRSVNKFDMTGVDNKNKGSAVYLKKVRKVRSDKGKTRK